MVEINVVMTTSGNKNESPQPPQNHQKCEEKELCSRTSSSSSSSTFQPKKKLGRSARRRNAKLRAIQHMSLVGGDHPNNQSGTSSSAVFIWPGVLEKRQEYGSFLTTTTESTISRDPYLIQRQLGYLPGNALRIVARRTTNNDTTTEEEVGEPTVLQLYPLALRQVYAGGGRSDGRKFKSRQRGTTTLHCTSSSTTTTTTTTSYGSRDAIQSPSLETQQHEEDFSSSSTSSSSSNSPYNIIWIEPEETPPPADNRRSNMDWRTMDGNYVLEPFPTIYWITCPKLRSYIGRLEEEGRISMLERRLREDPKALQSMEEAHTTYRNDRWSLLTPTDQEELRARNWNYVGGIAGIQRYDTIKCFHSHVAHYLAQGPSSRNIVGQWVVEALRQEYNFLI
jgi:hypothetical protein